MPARRSIFLINKRFQLKFALYVCSWLFALSLVYPLIIQSLFDYFIRYLSADPNGPELTALQGVRQEMLILLVIMQVVFLIVTFLISIFLSHRIAGPIYKLGLFFQSARSGGAEALAKKLSFRKNDHFQEIAAQYNEVMGSIAAREQRCVEAARRAQDLIERAASQTSGDAKANLDEAARSLLDITR